MGEPTHATAPVVQSGPTPNTPASPALAVARRVLRDEADAMAALADRAGDDLARGAELIAMCQRAGGTVVVAGLGKSGLVGQKISATLASIGIPSQFVHPTEAAHGDLGRFRSDDLAICLSHSGETAEVVGLAAILRQDEIGIISITRGPDTPEAPPSALDRLAAVSLHTGVHAEAGGDHVAAPTSSTTCTMALGDALALGSAALLGLGTEEFAKRHPGGQLGGLLRPVSDLLRFHVGDSITPVSETLSVRDALARAEVPGRRPGVLLGVDADGRLTGLFTDSDLRRLLLERPGSLDAPLTESMTPSPVTLREDASARDAVALVRSRRVDEIPVVDAAGRPVGVIDVQDLIALKLVQR